MILPANPKICLNPDWKVNVHFIILDEGQSIWVGTVDLQGHVEVGYVLQVGEVRVQHHTQVSLHK